MLLFRADSYVISYPRYPVYAWQLGFIVCLLTITIFVPLQAYYSRLLSKSGMEQYRQAVGMYLYVKTALQGRFEEGYLSDQEMKYYKPYAQAFGIDDDLRQRIKRRIS